jgi:hypothetical protein
LAGGMSSGLVGTAFSFLFLSSAGIMACRCGKLNNNCISLSAVNYVQAGWNAVWVLGKFSEIFGFCQAVTVAACHDYRGHLLVSPLLCPPRYHPAVFARHLEGRGWIALVSHCGFTVDLPYPARHV